MGTENEAVEAKRVIEALLADAHRDLDDAVEELCRDCDQAIELLSVASLACDFSIATHAGPLGDFGDLRTALHRFDYLHADAEGAYGLVKALQGALDKLNQSPHREDRGR